MPRCVGVPEIHANNWKLKLIEYNQLRCLMCLFKMPQENTIILFYRDCEHYDSLENEKGSTRDRREPLFKNMKTTKLRQCCQLLKCSIRYKGSPWTD